MKKLEVIGIIMIIVLLIALIVHIMVPTPPDKSFENQYVKFNYSPDLNMVDKSDNNFLFIIIYQGDPADKNIIGTIFTNEINKTNEETVARSGNSNIKETTINGYDAVIENQGDPGVEIYLNNTRALYMLTSTDSNYYADNMINSIIVKKAPANITPNTVFYEMNHQ